MFNSGMKLRRKLVNVLISSNHQDFTLSTRILYVGYWREWLCTTFVKFHNETWISSIYIIHHFHNSWTSFSNQRRIMQNELTLNSLNRSEFIILLNIKLQYYLEVYYYSFSFVLIFFVCIRISHHNIISINFIFY